jgi:hypothetical protein
MFKWETLREVEPQPLRYGMMEIPGQTYEVELTKGSKVQVWRSDDGEQYFCHGLTFGGKEAPGGVVSPYGKEVPTILREYYEPVAEPLARAGDILVWRGLGADDVVHSAVLTDPVVAEGKSYLDYGSRLQSKNGIKPEANRTLEELLRDYGESYNMYRRK